MICDPCKDGNHCNDEDRTSCFCQHRDDATLQTESPLLPSSDVKTSVAKTANAKRTQKV